MDNHLRDDIACSKACQPSLVGEALSVFGGSELLLDSYHNNLNQDKSEVLPVTEFCPNPINIEVEMVVHTDKGDVYRKTRVPCNSWSCSVCGKRNASKLKKRLRKAIKGLVPTLQADPDKARYSIKLLTLTVPGTSYRLSRSPEEAEVELKKCFHKITVATRKQYGAFEYVWVMEYCNGWPHLHVLLVGNNIAPMELLPYIRGLWCRRYGMGFVKLNCSGEHERAIHYMTKYVTKGLESGKKNYRVFSMSKEFGRLSKLDKIPVTILKVVRVIEHDDGTIERQSLWEAPAENPYLLALEQRMSESLQGEVALLEEQLSLFGEQ